MAPSFDYALDVGGGIVPIGTVADESTFAGLDRLDIPDLLAEAFRFYAFENRTIRKRGFLSFTPGEADSAVFALRWAFHEAMKQKLHGLYLCPGLRHFVNPETLRYVGTTRAREGERSTIVNSLFVDSASKARLAARVFLSPLHRTPRFVEKSRADRRKGEYSGVHLEKVEERLLAGRRQIAMLVGPEKRPAAPSHTVPYFAPALATYEEFGSAGNGRKPRRLRLVEHLHVLVGSPILGAERRPGGKYLRRPRGAPLPGQYSGIREILASWEGTLASLGSDLPDHTARTLKKGLDPFIRWRAGLDELELYFAPAARRAQALDLSDDLGLDWSLLLIHLLRWYIADLQIRTLMTSLPTHAFYASASRGTAQLNAYLGLALYEALLGMPLKHPSLPSVLDVDYPVGQPTPADRAAEQENALQGCATLVERHRLVGRTLHSWPGTAASSPFGACDSSHLTQGFARWPVIADFGVAAAKNRKQVTLGADGTIIELQGAPLAPAKSSRVYTQFELVEDPVWIARRTPLIHDIVPPSTGSLAPPPNFYRAAGLRRNSRASQLNVSATFGAQMSLFVASAALRRASRLWGLDAKYPLADLGGANGAQLPESDTAIGVDPKWDCAKYGQELERVQQRQLEGSVPKFRLGAGSYAFGGSFPPHLKHQTGNFYDLVLGPAIVPWPALRAREFLAVAYELLDCVGVARKETQLLAYVRRQRYRGVQNLYEVHQTADNWCYAPAMVRHQTLRRLQTEVLSAAIGEADEKIHADGEMRLRGTPHFASRLSGQLPHVGHLGILLSAPSQIIHASPIVHLRAMRALTSAASELDALDGTRGAFLELAVAIEKQCSFVCYPHNHHDHWHVRYADVGKVVPRALWLRLGLDLRPFRDYLYVHREDVHLRFYPGTHATADYEREFFEMVDFCNEYVDDFQALYPDALPPDNQGNGAASSYAVSDEADEALRAMFSGFVMESPSRGEWLDPAVPVGRQLMAPELTADASEIRAHLTAIYRQVYKIAVVSGDDSTFTACARGLLRESNEERRTILESLLSRNFGFLDEYMYQLFSTGMHMAMFGLESDEAGSQ